MQPGDQWGPYRILKPLGAGGMGQVFLARDVGPLDRTVVVKTMLPQLAEGVAAQQMFRREAQLLSRMSHPNLVQAFDFGEVNGELVLVMEHLRGRTLRAVRDELRKREETMDLAAALRVCADALYGLDHAHHMKDESGASAGVVHRDVSPDNIMLSFSGWVKVFDFGVARDIEGAPLTRTGTVKGKLPYMAPEVIRGVRATPAADIYSMGIVLYEAVTGFRPTVSDNALLSNEMAMVRWDATPQAVRAIVLRALAAEPVGRYASAKEMAEDLERVLSTLNEPDPKKAVARLVASLFDENAEPDDAAGAPVADRGATVSERPPSSSGTRARRKRRRPRVIVGAVIFAAAVGAFFFRPRPPPPVVAVHTEKPVPPTAPVAPPAPKPVPSSATTGKVDIRVNPWAEVYFGARRLGVTPMRPIELPAGAQTLRLRNRTLGVDRAYPVHVPAGGQTQLHVELR